MKKLISVITVDRAVEILKDNGFSTNRNHICAGLKCGAYPFGVAIPTGKSTMYEVYYVPLMKWIEERSIETNEINDIAV